METENYPPIPDSLRVDVSCKQKGANNPLLNDLGFVTMTGESAFANGSWKDSAHLGFKSAKLSEPNLDKIGLYTFGIATCVGIGVLFEGNGQRGVGLVHLSSDVVRNDGALSTILGTLKETGEKVTGKGSTKRVVLVFDGKESADIEELTGRIDNALTELAYTDNRIRAIRDEKLNGDAKMAGNASGQLGPYEC